MQEYYVRTAPIAENFQKCFNLSYLMCNNSEKILPKAKLELRSHHIKDRCFSSASTCLYIYYYNISQSMIYEV